ncbi:MAG: NAD(P)-dependent oxidoreductase [Chloroflexi bacterium]|nr:NAD(P)-dependent oxidoreductase [Chloroflexota bacterium]
MRVVVTGGSGRIGRWLVRELLPSHEVTIFDRIPPSELPPGVQYKLGQCEDLGEVYDVLRGHDAVVHLAAIPSNKLHPYPTVFRTNVVSTYNVAEAAGRLGLRKIVAASSINALGIPMAERPFAPAYLPIDEQHPRLPQDAYSLTKLVDEETLGAIHRRTGIPAIAIRPPLILWPDLPDGGNQLSERLADPSLSKRPMWVYCDVRDLVSGFRLALENETVEHETFFITADDALAREPLAGLLPRYVPGTEAMAAGLTGTSPAVVSTKAKRLLGYQPRYSWRDYPTDGSPAVSAE